MADSVVAMESWFLYDVLFNVMFSYLVKYYGDSVSGHLGGVCPVRIVA